MQNSVFQYHHQHQHQHPQQHPSEERVSTGVSVASGMSAEEAVAMAKKMLAEQRTVQNVVSAESARGIAEHVLMSQPSQPPPARYNSRSHPESLPDCDPNMRNFDSALDGYVHTERPPHHHFPPPAVETFLGQSEKYAPWLHLEEEEEESVPPTPPLVGTPQQRSPRRAAVDVLRHDVRRALDLIKESSRREALEQAAEGMVLMQPEVAPLQVLPHQSKISSDFDEVEMFSCCSDDSITEQQNVPYAQYAPLIQNDAHFRYEGNDPVAAPEEAKLSPRNEGPVASLRPAETKRRGSGRSDVSELKQNLLSQKEAMRVASGRQERGIDQNAQSIQILREQQNVAVAQLHEIRVAQMQQQQALEEQARTNLELIRTQQEEISLRQRSIEEGRLRQVEQIELEQKRVMLAERESAAQQHAHLVATPATPVTPQRQVASPSPAAVPPSPSTPVYFTPKGKPYVFDPISGKSKWLKTASIASSPSSINSPQVKNGAVHLNIIVK